MDHFSGEAVTHPVLSCAEAIEDALKEVRDVSASFMGTAEKRRALVQLARLQQQLAGLYLDVVATADDVAEEDGARSVGSWIDLHTRGDAGGGARSRRLAEDLHGTYTQVAAGVRDGRVNTRQAEVIVGCLNSFGNEVRPELRVQAEATLVELAGEFNPQQLRRLGEAILERLDPETFEDGERKRLEAALRRAQAETRLNLRNRGDGSVDLHARLPEAAAARLKTMLEAFTSPRHDRVTGQRLIDPATGQRLRPERARGEAFCALLEAMSTENLPLHGGTATSIVVTIDLDDLMQGIGCGTLGEGTPITAGEARRLACTAGIIPAVLGGNSEVLDLGRSQRLFNTAQRKALALHQRTCRAEGCDVPATWCEAHHRDPWAHGGRTDLDKGELLCSHHHHRAHDDRYRTTRHPDGSIRFHRRR